MSLRALRPDEPLVIGRSVAGRGPFCGTATMLAFMLRDDSRWTRGGSPAAALPYSYSVRSSVLSAAAGSSHCPHGGTTELARRAGLPLPRASISDGSAVQPHPLRLPRGSKALRYRSARTSTSILSARPAKIICWDRERRVRYQLSRRGAAFSLQEGAARTFCQAGPYSHRSVPNVMQA